LAALCLIVWIVVASKDATDDNAHLNYVRLGIDKLLEELAL